MKKLLYTFIESIILSVIILTAVAIGFYATIACIDWCIGYCAQFWRWI